MQMKRRYYLILFVVLFVAALWGLFHAVDMSAPVPTPPATAPLPPEVPAPATVTGGTQANLQ